MDENTNIDLIIKNNLDYLESLSDIKTIYHYTDIVGLKGILEDKNFKVSHAKFMNDISEIIYTQNLIIDELNKLKSKEQNSSVILIYNTFLEIMNNEFNYTASFEKLKYRAATDRLPEYILSFSLNEDSPHLWSTFICKDGYNIGIDFHSFYKKMTSISLNNSKPIIIPSKVIYDINRQKEIINLRIIEFVNIAIKYNFIFISNFYLRFLSSMRLFAIFFKNPLFFDDNEFRIVIFNYKNLGYINPEYRIKMNCLIPFIPSINYKKEIERKLLPVNSITIGPINHSDIAEEGLIYFMNDIGYNINEIEFKKSSIPLRF